MSVFSGNKIKTFHYFLVWLLYAVIQAVCLRWMVDIPFWILLIDTFVHAVMFAFFGLALWSMMLYGNYEKIPLFQRVINFSALAVLIILLWVGIGYGLDYLFFGRDIVLLFLPVLPLYAFIGVLLYLIIILYSRNKITDIRETEEIQAEETGKELIVEEGVLLPEAERLERITVKSGHKIHVILVPEILYVQADGDYVHIFTIDGKYMKEQTMKYFEENLPPAQFVRVHRSFIVNIESISRIEQYEKQNQLLTLKNGHHIKVSIGGYKLLKSKLGL